MAMYWVLNNIGVETITVIGEGHAWNMVHLYGDWYHTDVTNLNKVLNNNTDYMQIMCDQELEDFPQLYTDEQDDGLYISFHKVIKRPAANREYVRGDYNANDHLTKDDLDWLVRNSMGLKQPAVEYYKYTDEEKTARNIISTKLFYD